MAYKLYCIRLPKNDQQNRISTSIMIFLQQLAEVEFSIITNASTRSGGSEVGFVCFGDN